MSMSLLPLVRGGGAHNLPGSSGGSRNLADGDSRGTAPGLATDEILGAGLMDVVMHEVCRCHTGIRLAWRAGVI